MAPTICSEKKQLRAQSMKDARRRHITAAASSTSASGGGMATATITTTNKTSTNAATQSSSVLNYVATGSMNSATRQRLRGSRRSTILQRKQSENSDNVVSSSTHHHEEVEDEEKLLELQARMINKETTAESRRADLAFHYLPAQLNNMDNDSDYDDDEMRSNHSNGNGHQPATVVLQPSMANNRPLGATHCDTAHNYNTIMNHNDDDYDDNDDVDGIRNCIGNGEGDGNDDDDDDDDDDRDSGYGYMSSNKCIDEQHNTHNTEGLLSIAIKTIKLVQRNKLLQKRLAQLQLETSEFIASVLANPENRHFRDKITAKSDATSKVSNMLLRH